jgi:hypothetical protein
MTPTENQMPIGIDDDFEWINEQIQALKQLAQKDSVSEAERYDFSIRWGAALAGRLRRLVHYSSQNLLNDADERRFQSLCSELRGLSESIDRFKLAQPVFSATPSAKAKRHAGPRRSNWRRGPSLRRR